MSGIIGKLSFEHDETLARPVLEQMLAALQHRSHAGRRIYVGSGIALGWCGDEPLPISRPDVSSNDQHTVRVVADAALTNSRELRLDLKRRGHVLRRRTDADLIAHAYDEWGDSCVERLRGPFACAIWDHRRERLLLARDAIGIRPLFFALLPGHGLVFGSEIRALLQDPGVGREWCPQAIDAYLALGYVPSPLTIYQRISKVEPAQRLIVEGRRLHVEQYWDIPEAAQHANDAAVAEALDAILPVAVGRALDDDSASEILYSGGLASGVLLATTPRRERRAVTMAMEYDPVQVARSHAAATHLGFTPVLELAAPDIPAMAQRLATHLDEPLADPSAVTQYSTFLAGRLHMTTAVTGHGAATLWPDRRTGARPPAAPHVWDGEHRRDLYTRAFAWQVQQADPFARYRELQASHPGDRPSGQARYAELRTWVPDNTLVVAERAAAAAGLHLRFPFLTRELVELAARISLPPRGEVSSPLRLLLARRLPPALMPLPAWREQRHPWLHRALTAMVPAVLLGRRFDGRGIVSRPALQRLWEDHTARRHDHSHRLWSLLMLEFWFREFIDGDAADEPLEYAILRAA